MFFIFLIKCRRLDDRVMIEQPLSYSWPYTDLLYLFDDAHHCWCYPVADAVCLSAALQHAAQTSNLRAVCCNLFCPGSLPFIPAAGAA